VYYERVDASPPGIAALRTDIAGFVGIAPMGPPDTPVPVQSFRQFQANFGAFTGSGFLAYAVNAFFANGGTKCWVVRVAPPSVAAASVVLSSPAPGSAPLWRVEASSPGVWGNDLDITVEETHRAQTVSLGNSPVTPQWTAVASVSGFSRATLVRISQAGKPAVVYQYKVVSQVDATNGLLIWVAANPDDRLPYDAPLSGFAANRPLLIESVEYTLLVWNLGRLLRTYQGLSLVPEHPNYGPVLLPPLQILQANPAMVPKSSTAPEPVALRELRQVDALPVQGFQPIDVSGEFPAPLVGGVDGLALLSVYDFIGEDVDPLDDDVTRARKQRGLRALDLVDEVSILAVPDIQIRPIEPPAKVPRPPCVPDPCLPAPPPGPAPGREPAVGDLPPIFTDDQVYQVQVVMIARCEQLRDRFALLDPPFLASRNDAAGAGAIRAWRARFDSQFAAIHYPWLRVVDPLLLGGGAGLTRDFPPCGHVAGQMASTDLTQGVFKAPANAPLAWVQDVTVAVNDALHGVLNRDGINAIRALPGRGIRILGARTVSSDTDWRFINVRRLMMMIEKAILVSTQWAVFEPNDVHTRSKLRLSLTSFLIALWQRGALLGDSPAAAFYVTCDASNNPPAAVDEGQLLAEVGVAPSQPFEFVVVRVGRTDNQFQVTDVGTQ
jgi:hypothetical protein